MNSSFSLILIVSILGLTIKYMIDLKTNRYLLIILFLIVLTYLSYILGYSIENSRIALFGLIPGMIISPLLFAIHLLKGDRNKKIQNVKKLMLVPTIGLLTSYLSKSIHWQGATVTNLIMIIPILAGIYLTFNKTQLIETKVMQIFLIFLTIDFMTFVIK